MKKPLLNLFFGLLLLSLLTPFWVFSHLQFPYITSKAFYFRVLMELALPVYLYLIAADKQLRPKLRNPLNIAALAFLAINIISSFTGVNAPRSLWGNFERMGGAYYLAHLVALYFYLQLLGQAGGRYLKLFLQAFVGIATLVAINGLSGWLGGPKLVLDPSLPVRASSTFGNPIFFASYLVLPMFLSAYLAAQDDSRGWKIAYWVAAGLQLLGIYSSGTRGAEVGLIVGLLVSAVLYIALTKNSGHRRYGLLLLGFCLVLGGLVYGFHAKIKSGSTLYRLVNLKDTNSEARLEQWKIALTGYKDHPILGVGPENYYVIFDTYYNPIMYKYDASWFDKPHNYLIEVLTTNGALGLLAYLAMFVLAVYALWRAYKAGLVGLLEMCLLVCGLIVYQAQNIFVFDTVSASIAFYGFLGLIAYMWVEASGAKVRAAAPSGGDSWQAWLLGLSAAAMLYVLYIGNIESMEAAKRTNFGFAYGSVDAQKAADYFSSALAVPFNLDPRETANRYSDFAASLLSNPPKGATRDFVTKQLDAATANQRLITEKTANDPLLYMRLSLDEMDEAVLRGQNFDQALAVINKTISIAPKRIELMQSKLQLYGFEKDWKDAVALSEQIVQLDPYNPSLRWQLALTYELNGRTEEAVKEGDAAIAAGYEFTALNQFAWYIQYYEGKKDWARVAPLLEKAVVLQPTETGLYLDLAKTYSYLGNNEKARLLAQQVEQMDPTQKAAMEQFISTLK